MATKTNQLKAWNKGKIIGPKPALSSRQVAAIKLVMAEQSTLRDRLMFHLAIDSCLRGCDLVRLSLIHI